MKLNQLEKYSGDSIIYDDIIYSYESLVNQINIYEKYLFLKIKYNEIIIIDSDYSFHSISLLLALSEFPCIIVPIVRTTDNEFNSKVQASGANKIITIDIKANLCIDSINESITTYAGYMDITSQNRSGIVLFSSGTTGAPKVMVHDFNVLLEGFKPPRRQKKLNFLLFLMFDHIGGLNTLLGCLNNGSTIIVPTKRTPSDILYLIEKYKIQILPTSPTFLNLMLLIDDFEKRNLSSLRMITYGTERMPVALLNKLNKLIPQVRFLQTFGTSETGILKTQSKSSSSLYFKIVDDESEHKIENNQLFIKSKTSVKSYKELESNEFTDDGWFATGDLVDVDNEGYLKIVGRINQVINVGGLKVLPVEVEDIINSIEGVLETTVYAKENSITGQMVFARVIISKNMNEKEIKEQIKKICKQSLDKYKRPVKIEISKEIKATTRFKKEIFNV
jgi:acyl-coenzyme A synthetase/AMP-(fatty) acid ligase